MKRPVIISLLVTALVLVCMGIGAVVFFGIGANRLFSNNSPFDTRNISSQVEENKTLKVDASKPVTLKVDDAAGDVTVTGADVDAVQVEVVKTAYDSTQARAEQEVKTQPVYPVPVHLRNTPTASSRRASSPAAWACRGRRSTW